MRKPLEPHRSSRPHRRPTPWWPLAILLLGIATPLWAQELPEPGTWRTVANLNQARAGHTATLLANGSVLIAGGRDASGHASSAAEIYDPATRTFSLAPSTMIAPRESHTATSLADGRVLIAGGSNASGALNTSELYDPPGGTITAAGPLNLPRTLASAALLLDGTVLVAGGQATGNVDLNSAEVYDPVTNTFALLPALMSTARSGHAGLRLPDNGR